MAGHLGDERVTTQSLEVVAADAERGLLLIKGAVPGSENGWVLVKDAVKRKAAGRAAVPGGAARRRPATKAAARGGRRRAGRDGRRGGLAMRATVRTSTTRKSATSSWPRRCSGCRCARDILARVVNWQLAKRRAGTHKTKGISDISGTTKKPYKQKGTGRARQGSLRSPQFRGGAVIFGPVVRSHEFGLQKKVRRLGLKTALSAKQAEGKLVVHRRRRGSTRPRPRRCGRGSTRSAGARC